MTAYLQLKYTPLIFYYLRVLRQFLRCKLLCGILLGEKQRKNEPHQPNFSI